MRKESLIKQIVAGLKDDDVLTPEMMREMVESKREENDKHFFQMGFKYAHAMFRHMAKQLEHDDDTYVVVFNRYLSDFHEKNFEDDDYRDGYIATEEDADHIATEFIFPEGGPND